MYVSMYACMYLQQEMPQQQLLSHCQSPTLRGEVHVSGMLTIYVNTFPALRGEVDIGLVT